MKPSFTPCAFSKLSLYFARSSMTAVMSTSLNVVSDAASCCAWTSRSATRLRSGDIGDDLVARIDLREPLLDRTGRRGVAAPPSRGGSAPCSRAATRCDGVSFSSASLSSDSPLPVILVLAPTARRGRLRRCHGAAARPARRAPAIGGHRLGRAAAARRPAEPRRPSARRAGFAAALPAAPALTAPITSPTFTVAPTAKRCSASAPATGDGSCDRDLVGLELRDRLVDRDALADLLEPSRDDGLGDRFTELWNYQISHSALRDLYRGLRTLA